MLNAAEIAKQADAMLAEREQEMKELEQQKRRARDIMFKKTQQLKVRPLNPDSGIRVVEKGSWKKLEVGKFLPKLESFFRSWKVALSHFSPIFPTSLFPISCRTFQLKVFQRLVFSNCPFQLHVSTPSTKLDPPSPVRDLRYLKFGFRMVLHHP